MATPLMYNFLSVGSTTTGAKPSEDLSATQSVVGTNMREACDLLSPDLWDGCVASGHAKIKDGECSITLQKFRTQGIDARLVIFNDAELLVYFICKKGEGRFSVMRCEKKGKLYSAGTDLYGDAYGIAVKKPEDIAFLRRASASLAPSLKRTFDAAFSK